jgi:hypothetical protein
MFQVGMPAENETEDGGKQQQQRENSEQRVESDDSGLAAGLVVAKLLDNRKRQADDGVALLEAVESAYYDLRAIHLASRDIQLANRRFTVSFFAG